MEKFKILCQLAFNVLVTNLNNFFVGGDRVNLTINTIDLNLLAQPVMLLGGSGIVGFAIGIFVKKIIRVILFISGAIFAFLAWLSYEKMISIDWNEVGRRTQEAAIAAINALQQVLSKVMTQFQGDNNVVGLGVIGLGFTGGLVAGLKT